MKRHFVVLAIVGLASTLLAQLHNMEIPECDHDGIREFRGDLIHLLNDLEPFLDSFDIDSFLVELQSMRTMIGEFDAECRGYVFTSEEYGLDAVVGPVTFQPGLYVSQLESSGGILVEFDIVDGPRQCGFIRLDVAVDATESEESFRISRECTILLDVTNLGSSEWEMRFSRLE